MDALGQILTAGTSIFGTVADGYVKVKTGNDALKQQQLAANGMYYTNGLYNAQQGGISPTLLLLAGGALLLVFVLQK